MKAVRFIKLCRKAQREWEYAITAIGEFRPMNDGKAQYLHYNNKFVSHRIIHADRLGLKDKVKKTRIRKNYPRVPCKCPNCGKRFKMPYYLNSHLVPTMKRVCYDCGVIVNREKLGKHLRKSHKRVIFECNICWKLFDEAKNHDLHSRLAHSNDMDCKFCGAAFTTARALDAHTYSHRIFHCSNCTKTFDNRKCYYYHAKMCKSEEQTQESTFICDYCKQSYNKKPSLKIHIIQKHLQPLPFTCDICGKRTSTLAHLRTHENVHKIVRKMYKCACGEVMRSLFGYNLHQRLHTGEKPYKCEECGERFLSSSRRTDHIKRRHKSSDHSHHECTMCNARFIRPCELKRHYISAHSLLAYVPSKQRVTHEALCPTGLCTVCTNAVFEAYNFISLAKSSMHIWQHSVASLNTINDNTDMPVKCMLTFLSYENNKGTFNMFNHLETLSDSEKVVQYLAKEAAVKKRRKIQKKNSAFVSLDFECKDCGKRFLSPYLLNAHLKNSGQKDACTLCGVVLFRGKDLEDHIKNRHKQNAYRCSECNVVFFSKIELFEHGNKAHSSGVLTCNDCGRTFPRKVSFELHQAMHAVRTCRACGGQFTNRACYREHRSICEPLAKPDIRKMTRNRRANVRDPAMYICDYCNKTYNAKPQLKNHIKWIHMDVRPYECKMCKKKFFTKGRLAEHTVVHTRVRKFECDICGTKLVSKMAAVYHRRRHTGEKPYECDICGAKFISASRRLEHSKRKHLIGHRKSCTFCSATYVRGIELKKHMAKAHCDLDKRKDTCSVVNVEKIGSNNGC